MYACSAGGLIDTRCQTQGAFIENLHRDIFIVEEHADRRKSEDLLDVASGMDAGIQNVDQNDATHAYHQSDGKQHAKNHRTVAMQWGSWVCVPEKTCAPSPGDLLSSSRFRVRSSRVAYLACNAVISALSTWAR